MIKITNISQAYTTFTVKVEKGVEQQLAGDIENFLLHKGFVVDIEVK